AAPAQLLEQTLGRPAFPPRQLGFLLQDLAQALDPLAQLGRRLNISLVLELRRLAADHLAHRRPRHRQRPHDLLDRPLLLEIRPPYPPDVVHANHPPHTLPSRHWHYGRETDTQPWRGVIIRRENRPSGGHYCARFYRGEDAGAGPARLGGDAG